MRIWVIVCIQEPFHHFLQTFHYTCLGLFRDGSLFYPKQLSLFFRLLLISACADSIGCNTSFCSTIGLSHELKNNSVNIEAYRHLIMPQQGERKATVTVATLRQLGVCLDKLSEMLPASNIFVTLNQIIFHCTVA